jgi:hypothetical protein
MALTKCHFVFLGLLEHLPLLREITIEIRSDSHEQSHKDAQSVTSLQRVTPVAPGSVYLSVRVAVSHGVRVLVQQRLQAALLAAHLCLQLLHVLPAAPVLVAAGPVAWHGSRLAARLLVLLHASHGMREVHEAAAALSDLLFVIVVLHVQHSRNVGRRGAHRPVLLLGYE